MSNELWITASQDAQETDHKRLFTALRVEATEYWPLLADAESPDDFSNRLALIATDLDKLVRKHVKDEGGTFLTARRELEDAFIKDFDAVYSTRKQADSYLEYGVDADPSHIDYGKGYRDSQAGKWDESMNGNDQYGYGFNAGSDWGEVDAGTRRPDQVSEYTPRPTASRTADYKYVKPAGGGKYKIVQKGTGKTLSVHDSKEKAEAAFRAMEMNMHGGSKTSAATNHHPFKAAKDVIDPENGQPRCYWCNKHWDDEIHNAKDVEHNRQMWAARKYAAGEVGYYVVSRNGSALSGPYATMSDAAPFMIEQRGASVQFQGPGDSEQWAATKAKPFPIGSNTVNGSKNAGVIESDDYRDEEARLKSDPIVIALADEVRGSGTDLSNSGFMNAVNREYHARGGNDNFSIGGVARAIRAILGGTTASVHTGNAKVVKGNGGFVVKCDSCGLKPFGPLSYEGATTQRDTHNEIHHTTASRRPKGRTAIRRGDVMIAGEGAYVTDSHNSSIKHFVDPGTHATATQGYQTWVGTTIYDWAVEGQDGDGWQLGGEWVTGPSATASKTAADPGWISHDPDWWANKNKGGYGMPNNHPFWSEQLFEDVGQWRIFDKDGTTYAYNRRQNAWLDPTTSGDRKAILDYVNGFNSNPIDIWASAKTAVDIGPNAFGEDFGGRTPTAQCAACGTPIAQLSPYEWVDRANNKAYDSKPTELGNDGFHEHYPRNNAEPEWGPVASRRTASGDPIGYTYEADVHCPACALARFGRDQYGDIGGDSTDREGNPIGVIAPWDETPEDGEYCSDCNREIAPPWHTGSKTSSKEDDTFTGLVNQLGKDEEKKDKKKKKDKKADLKKNATYVPCDKCGKPHEVVGRGRLASRNVCSRCKTAAERTFPCTNCGADVTAWNGMDEECPRCGTLHNCFGQHISFPHGQGEDYAGERWDDEY